MPKKSKRVSLKDIADQAEVSRMTVSLALRNAQKIPLATRKRIQRIAQHLGYQNDAQLSRMFSQMRAAGHKEIQETIALVFSDKQKWDSSKESCALGHIIRGMEAHAKKNGFRVEPFFLTRQMSPDRLKQILVAQGIGCVVAAPIPEPETQFQLDVSGFSAATIAHTVKEPKLHRVTTDNYGAICLAIEQLRERGYSRIGVVHQAGPGLRIVKAWDGAYLMCSRELFAQGESIPRLVIEEDQLEKIIPWIKKYRVDAVLCGFKMGVLHTLKAAGLRIPQDLGYVQLITAEPGENVAHIRQNEAEVGEAVFNVVFGQWVRNEKGASPNPRTILISPSWVEGETVRPLKSRKRSLR